MEGGGESIKAESINIMVRDQTGGEVHFKVKLTTKFTKITQAYASKKGITETGTLRFIFDGKRIGSDSTPHDVRVTRGPDLLCQEHAWVSPCAQI